MEVNRNVCWAYPFQFDRNGRVKKVGGKSTVEATARQLLDSCGASLRQLLFTSPGERVMIPEFGVNSEDHVFTNVQDSVLGFLSSEISQQISSWSTRVSVESVDVRHEMTSEGSEVHVTVSLRHRLSGTIGTATAVFK